MSLHEITRSSLVNSALNHIREQIEMGHWKVGGKIPKEAELCEILQVGRNTVREAIRVLSHAEVLEVRQGNGTYVRSNVDPGEVMRRISRARLRDHLELRVILETEAARLAAQRRTDEDLEVLGQLLEQRGELQGEEDLTEFVERDVAFHLAIAKASQNKALEELYRYFSATVGAGTQQIFIEQQKLEPGLVAHGRILEAIRRKDAEAAADAAHSVIRSLSASMDSRDRQH
jgi:DNA-binding FadR family transcriptional regulator